MTPHSLILANPNAKPRLFPKARLKARHNCTGEQLARRDPEKYQKAVEMLSDPQYTFKAIQNEIGLCYDSLRAIYEREQIPIDNQREILKRQSSRILRRLADRIEEQAPTMKDRDAIFGFNVVSRELALLTGHATSHTLNFNVNARSVDVAAQFEKLHAQIRDANKGDSRDVQKDRLLNEEKPASDEP